MPEWCPRCHAMLPEGLESCPRCGKRLRSGSDDNLTLKDILSLSSSVLLIILIPVVLIIIGALLCTVLGN